MKTFYVLFSIAFSALIFSSENVSAQITNGDTAYALCNVGTYQFAPFAGTDCWGYVDSDNVDYAIMGIDIGVVFVDVTNGNVVDTVLGPGPCGASHRDMATYQDICYVVSECGGLNQGLMVIDMQYLPDSVHFLGSLSTPPAFLGTSYYWSHNLSVDTARGFLYCEGWGGGGWTNTNIFILDLTDPRAPVSIAGFGSNNIDIHDMHAHNDTVFVANGFERTYSIWDLTDKNNPMEFASWSFESNGFAHNVWPTADKSYVVTTEETAGHSTKVWDIQNLANITLVGEFLAPSSLAHNAHVKGDTIYISHYESGVSVLVMSGPSNLKEIGSYDTYPTDFAQFSGAWGTYPFSPNGYVFVSNTDGKLFVLKENVQMPNDSIFADSVGVSPGGQVRVDVHVKNTSPENLFIIPFSWSGSVDINFDSASLAGTRADYFEVFDLISINPFADEMAFRLVSSYLNTSPQLSPGSGPIMSLYFSVPEDASDGTVSIKFKSVSGNVVAMSDLCISILPDTASGAVTVCAGCGVCCEIPGDANRSGSTNIADATYLIAYIFSGGSEPVCPAEGDPNGSGSINISDATYLIAMIFSGGAPAVCGPSGP